MNHKPYVLMRHIGWMVVICLWSFSSLQAQGYRIRIQLNGLSDSTVYLARYLFDQVPVIDSCKHIKNGEIVFQGRTALETGVYIVANQQRNSFYMQFIVDEKQVFNVSAETRDVAGTFKSDEPVNNGFYAYINYINNKNIELAGLRFKYKSNKDSAKIVSTEQIRLNNEIKAYEKQYLDKNKSSFVVNMLKLKNEHYPEKVPLAANGRPDSIYHYNYYRSHYFDDINFKDDRMLNTPFFGEKIKGYFENIAPHHPDSIIKDMDVVLGKCIPGSAMFNTLVGHFTYKYETNKEMSFDRFGKSQTYEKVFVHLCEKYIISGQTKGYYAPETVDKIRERVSILKNLLPGARMPEFYGIDTANGAKVLKMGFDTAVTSESCTKLYKQHEQTLVQMFRPLNVVHGKYHVVVFWAADCGHCKTEVPKLSEDLRKLQSSIDVKVIAIQTKEELYKEWKKFIAVHKLDNFYHLFDPVHINNLKEKFDISGTPVIYLLDQDYKIIGKKLDAEAVSDIILKLEELENNRKKNKSTL